ncbi:MAG: DNA-binding response regulator [Bacteroidales bacterium]|nr:DNA-binding response regulator [Bacteroidales bacterium]
MLLPKGDVHVKESERETFIEVKEDIGMYRGGDHNADSSSYHEDKIFQGATVLVVEDNFELRKFIASSLENQYTLLEAENGKQALELAKEELPDIIVSDVMMPEMDGITMCFKLKTDVKTSHIPVILLTARKSRYYKVKGLETGADDYISKPFYEDELKIRIKNHLKLRHDLRQKYLLDASLKPEEVVLSSPDEIFIKDLCEIIEKNMDQSELKAEDISRELAMSHSLVYKKLKAITGMSIVEFVRDFRLKKAESLLVQDKLSVSDVCYMVGFNNRNYFSAWFKKKYKASPRDYVKSHLESPK